AGVGGGRGDRFRRGDGPLYGRGIERGADENSGGIIGPQRRVRHIGQADGARGDVAPAQGEEHGGGRGRVVADLALELLVGGTVTVRGNRNTDCSEDLAGRERGDIGAAVELARRNAALARFAD